MCENLEAASFGDFMESFINEGVSFFARSLHRKPETRARSGQCNGCSKCYWACPGRIVARTGRIA